jgi:hypothetical protein
MPEAATDVTQGTAGSMWIHCASLQERNQIECVTPGLAQLRNWECVDNPNIPNDGASGLVCKNFSKVKQHYSS